MFSCNLSGDVYLIQFPLPDQPDKTITKYAVNLQEGRIIYCLSPETMREIDERLLLGVGIVRIEDLEAAG